MKQSSARTLFAVAITLASASALAEIKADGQWRGAGGAALAATSGNTSSSNLVLTANAVRATDQDKITLGAMANYARGEVSGTTTTTANKWALTGGYDWNLSPKLFLFGKAGLEADRMIDLSRRISLAAGAGYHVINDKVTTFDVYGGLGYVTDRYRVAQTIGGETDTTFSRASLYLGEASTHKLSETTSFEQRLDLYPGLSGDKAVIAKFMAGLSVAMSSTMNLTVGLTDTYNSKPPLGKKKNDLGVFTGVNVLFGAK